MLVKLLPLLLLLAILIIFFGQNLQAVSLVFLGSYTTPQLPLALWIILFTGAGLLTSLLLQNLNYLSKPREKAKKQVEKKQSLRDKFRPSKQKPAPRTYRDSDWEEEEEDEWNIEEPPTEPTVLPRNPPQERKLEDKTPSIEAEKQPKSTVQSNSTYSYSYRKSNSEGNSLNKESNSRDDVYDANYRVIIPPINTNNTTNSQES